MAENTTHISTELVNDATGTVTRAHAIMNDQTNQTVEKDIEKSNERTGVIEDEDNPVDAAALVDLNERTETVEDEDNPVDAAALVDLNERLEAIEKGGGGGSTGDITYQVIGTVDDYQV